MSRTRACRSAPWLGLVLLSLAACATSPAGKVLGTVARRVDFERDPPRFPTLESPRSVSPGREFAVQVSLTLEQLTPEVVVQQGEGSTPGTLELDLPAPPSPEGWPLDVVLSASGFSFATDNTARIFLPRGGDSTPALFRLRAPEPGARSSRIYATFWYEGSFLARVHRAIEVTRAETRPGPVAAPGRSQVRGLQVPAGGAPELLSFARRPDLTLYILERGSDGAGGTSESEIIIASPHLRLSKSSYRTPPGLRQWLDQHYARFAAASRGGSEPGGPLAADGNPRANRLMRGFGRELYQRFAPDVFKRAYWSLVDRLGSEFQTLQIYSDGALLPWELMRPVRADGSDERDFLGTQLRVGRWYISPDATSLDRPPPEIRLEQVIAIAPEYPPARALPGQAQELTLLREFAGDDFVRWPASAEAFASLFAKLPRGIVHFAGHGRISTLPSGLPRHALILEDGELDLLAWRGMLSGLERAGNPFVFFNACDVGRATGVANFVNGWAPAILELGAGGYLGALWPVGDESAVEFARAFYANLSDALAVRRRALVSDIVQRTRQSLAAASAPTFLSYVYYGDPELRIVRAGPPFSSSPPGPRTRSR